MDLNIRNVPEEIMRSLRVDAAAGNTTLRELCLKRLVPDGGESWKPQTITGQPITEPAKPTARAKPAKAAPVVKSESDRRLEAAIAIDDLITKAAPEPQRSTACPECGSLSGHQRGCKRGK